MNFGSALELLKAGEKVARIGWNGKGMWIAMADLGIESHRPFLMIKTAQDQFVPWVASNGDLLGEDWVGIE